MDDTKVLQVLKITGFYDNPVTLQRETHAEDGSIVQLVSAQDIQHFCIHHDKIPEWGFYHFCAKSSVL